MIRIIHQSCCIHGIGLLYKVYVKKTILIKFLIFGFHTLKLLLYPMGSFWNAFPLLVLSLIDLYQINQCKIISIVLALTALGCNCWLLLKKLYWIREYSLCVVFIRNELNGAILSVSAIITCYILTCRIVTACNGHFYFWRSY